MSNLERHFARMREIHPRPWPVSAEARALARDLRARDHFLLSSRGKLFVTSSGELTADDLVAIQTHTEALLLLAAKCPMPTVEAHNAAPKPEAGAPGPSAGVGPSASVGPSALGFVLGLLEEEPVPLNLDPKIIHGGPAVPFTVNVHAEPEIVNQVLEPIVEGLSAAEIKLRLDIRGHHLLTNDGRFFISDAGKLTDDEKRIIKSRRDELIPLSLQAPTPPQPVTDAAVANDVDPCRGATETDVSRASGELTGTAPGQESPSFDSTLSQSIDITFTDQRIVASDTPSFFEDRPTQTLAQFLNDAPLQIDPSYVPDEPPDLSGIDEIILNFATSGLDWAGSDRPGGVTVASMDGKLCRFLPFGFKHGGNLSEEAVKRWAKEQLVGKKITNARTKFDIHQSREWGIDLESQGCTFSDIQHTAALLDDHRKKVALDNLAQDYFPGEPFIARVDERRHLEHHASEVAEREKFTALLVGRLRDVMYPEIDKQDLRRVQDLEDAVIAPVVEMEKNGSPIDMELLEQFGIECNAKHDALMWEISKECGFAFEHTASGWKRLIESLHLEVPDSFSESMLNEVDHPLVRKGQRASQYASLNSKIFKAYPEHIRGGILRYSINQLASDDGGTASGRFSIGIVQQVPNAYNHGEIFGDELFPRRLFVPGSGDYFEADAAQIEFRLLVHYSKNAKLLQAYRDDPWMSFHKQMQSMLIAYKPDMNYAHTKSYNFAAQYGAKSIKLAIMMAFITERVGDEIRKAERWDDPRLKTIKEIEAAYRKAHPEATALLDRASHLMKNECDKYCKRGDELHREFPHRGFVKTMLGRRSRCINNYKPYIGLNRVLQGSGADIMKKKLVELHAERKQTGFVMRITNHDAALGDAMEAETKEKVSAILNVQSYPLKVPIFWECGTGKNWAECK